MKNAMKKLTSLLLVALLLVGMIPFAASAAEAVCTGGLDCTMPYGQHNPGCLALPCDYDLRNDGACSHVLNMHKPECPMACNGTENCPQAANQDVTYHMNGCLSIVKSDVPVTNEVACTNSYDCKHVGNQHIAGCPMIPCTNSDTCDHGGWEHQPTCPKAKTGCANNASCQATDLHVETCPKYVKPADPEPIEPAVTTYTITFYAENGSVLRTATVNQGDLFPSDPMTLAAMEAGSKDGYNFAGWFYNGTNKWFTNDQLSIMQVNGNTTLKAYFTPASTLNSNKLNNYQVYLDIYKDTMVGSPDKRINITTGIALDDKVTMAEVKSLVMNYYSAKNSYGIGFDGLYRGYGDWVLDYVTDEKVGEMNTAGRKSDVVIKVMITNATAKGTYTADASNPKTGDNIYTAMTVMGVSAASLAAVMYFYNKKRMAL